MIIVIDIQKNQSEKPTHIASTNVYILVEGPKWGDTRFYGRWLLAATRANKFWNKALKDPKFKNQVQRVCLAYIPDFAIAAMGMLMRLKEYRTAFVLDSDSEDGEDFAMMVTMGFFSSCHQHYRMSVPSDLTIAKIREAILRYAETEDEDCALHPEYLVKTMSFSEARAWPKSIDVASALTAKTRSKMSIGVTC